MKNEPIAWGFFDDDGVIYDCVTNQDYCGENGRPLYTHPHSAKSVKAKTLTDEEIKAIAIQHIEMRLDGDRFGYFDFARAILKKASEG